MNIRSTIKTSFSFAIVFLLTGTLSQAQTVYQTDRMGLIATDLESGQSTQILHPNLDYAGGIWVDTNSGQLYWADLFAQTVMTAPVDTTQPGLRAIANSVDQNLGWPTDVLVDSETETIYFTVREGSESEKESALFSMDFNGQILDTLLSEEDGLDRPNALAWDKENNIIYVADADEGVFNVSLNNDELAGPLEIETYDVRSVALDPQNDKLYMVTTTDEIHRTNTDGSSFEVLVEDGFVDGQHIKVDVDAGKIYWTSTGDSFQDTPGKIQRANLDGSQVEDVYTSDEHAFSGLFLDTAQSEMYVVQRNTDSILKMDMDGSNVSELYNADNTGLVNPKQMVYNDQANEFIWTRSYEAFNESEKIIRTAADGSSGLDVILTYNAEINSIALDKENSRLFWAISEGYSAQLYVGDLDGSNSRMLKEINASSTTRINDITYKPSTNELFWVVEGSENIRGIHRMEVEAESSKNNRGENSFMAKN